MAPRINKRQQRELEELQALAGSSTVDISSEEEELTAKPAFSGFLVTEELESASENEGSVKPVKSRKKKKSNKKKVPAFPTPQPQKASKDPVSELPRNEKKALKKAKAKEKKAGDDQLEQALAELSVTLPNLQKPTTATQDSQSLATLLSVSLTHLDGELEMRKFFGAKVIKASKTSTSGPGRAHSSSSSSSRRHAALQRSNLTRPQPSWASASQREGLSIRTLAEQEVGEKQRRHGWDSPSRSSEKWWTIEYSQRYKSMSKLFFQAVMGGDPDALWEVQRKLPWHADNLLQLAEVYRHREEYAQAVDFVDRAIFTYERAFIGAFNFTSGLNRLDFDHAENRPFFLAVHRQVADLQRRGCVRTAFEFARLLYSLDPWEDPHGALYHLDLLALKGGMAQWLVDLYDHFDQLREQPTEEDANTRMDPSLLPGFLYARALALKMLENTGKKLGTQTSTAALEEALLSFPSIVPLLADKIDVVLPVEIRSHRDFTIETDARSLTAPVAALHALSHMYVLRSSGLWKEPEYSSWFRSTAIQTFSTLPTALPSNNRREAFLKLLSHESLQYSIYRHITVLESTHGRLFSFIPARVLEVAKSLACDPLPPHTALSRYGDAYFEGTEDIPTIQPPRSRRLQQRAVDERMFEQMVPDPEIRERINRMLEGLAGQFPGGLPEMIEALGHEAVGDLVEQVQEMMIRGENENVPGQMPGLWNEGQAAGDDAGEGGDAALENGQGGGDGEEDAIRSQSDSDDEDNPSAIQRLVRNVLGRFWGGRDQADETSSDEDEDPIDDNGVD